MLCSGDWHVTVGVPVALYPASHRTSHEVAKVRFWVQFPSAMFGPSVTLHGLGWQLPVDCTDVVLAVAHVTTWLPTSA